MFWQDLTKIIYWEGGSGQERKGPVRQENVGCLLGVWKNILKCGSSMNIRVWRARSTIVQFCAIEDSPPPKAKINRERDLLEMWDLESSGGSGGWLSML